MTKSTEEPLDLSSVRTTLALDRTLFASIRTALSLTGFGFTLAKFVHDMIVKGTLHGVQPSYPRQVGFALMGFGLLTVIGGAIEYVRVGRKIGYTGFVWSISLITSIGIGLLGLYLMWSLGQELAPL